MRLVSKAVLAAFAAVASLALTVEARTEEQMTKSLTGLQHKDTKVGTGATPKIGQTAVMHYTGWLYNNGEKGKKFDSSHDRGQPF
ncbi:MAG: FKBP-type peptidyl-prolyl cis-trans isomerase, partial [Methylocystis sp.]